MTKINIRSPFYLRYDEPDVPSVALDCDLVNLQDMTIDQFGNITLPTLDYGDIDSYTSTAGDFSNGKFDTVLTDTSRTVTFSIRIPVNFSNASDDIIDCDATFTQPAFVCTGGVTLNGSIPNQSLDTGGDTVDIDLTSYFTQGVDPIVGYNITNSFPTYIQTSINNGTLSLFSGSKTGTITIFVEADDGDPNTCSATQSIQTTISAAQTYACGDAFFTGGSISNLGVITNPSLNGTITSIKDTSGGTPITSYPSNTTGSARSVTLFFDITVPSGVGYTNEGATVECSKTFTQSSVSLPEFDCEVAGLTGQAIALNGTVKIGTANKGTISSFTPLSFEGYLSTSTERTVTFNITPPASGYANSGGSNISCPVTMLQPAVELATSADISWSIHTQYYDYLTREQYEAAGNTYVTNYSTANKTSYYRTQQILEFNLDICRFSNSSNTVFLVSDNILDNINTGISNNSLFDMVFDGRLKQYVFNNTGAVYLRLRDRRGPTFGSTQICPQVIQNFQTRQYYIRVEPTRIISEIWYVHHTNKTFQRLA